MPITVLETLVPTVSVESVRKVAGCSTPLPTKLLNNLISEIVNVYPDDREFTLPQDMLAKIKELIRKDYPEVIKDGEEVNIDKDNKLTRQR